MVKRKFQLPSIDTFQKRLEDFWQTVKAQKTQHFEDTVKYMELVYDYHLLGMSLSQIAEATGIGKSTVQQWVKKMEKQKALPSA